MSAYWANFARSGAPGGSGLPEWPAYTTQDKQIMVLGEKPAAGPLPDAPALDFLRAKMRGIEENISRSFTKGFTQRRKDRKGVPTFSLRPLRFFAPLREPLREIFITQCYGRVYAFEPGFGFRLVVQVADLYRVVGLRLEVVHRNFGEYAGGKDEGHVLEAELHQQGRYLGGYPIGAFLFHDGEVFRVADDLVGPRLPESFHRLLNALPEFFGLGESFPVLRDAGEVGVVLNGEVRLGKEDHGHTCV
jgi:hypothetical protein